VHTTFCFVKKLTNHSIATFNKIGSKSHFQNKVTIYVQMQHWSSSTAVLAHLTESLLQAPKF